MTINLTTEKVGRRVYVCGNTYSIKSQLKNAGCKWDPERKQWWIGSAKADAIESIVGKLDGQKVETDKQDLADRQCYGKVEYKGRTYYVVGVSHRTGKLWLTVLDCSIDFWAAESACRWVKRYESQQRWAGYGAGNVESYQTVGSIRRFIERNKSAKKRGYSDASEERAERRGVCREPGCTSAPAPGKLGYCERCYFDEFDC